MKHGTYDAFWKARNIRPHLKDIKPVVMTVGGWFDAENVFGALEVYRNVKKNSPKTGNLLVMGPWVHGGWSRDEGPKPEDVSKLGDISFRARTAEFYREHIELPFFERCLKGKQTQAHPEAWVFETGTNVWRKHAAWRGQAGYCLRTRGGGGGGGRRGAGPHFRRSRRHVEHAGRGRGGSAGPLEQAGRHSL